MAEIIWIVYSFVSVRFWQLLLSGIVIIITIRFMLRNAMFNDEWVWGINEKQLIFIYQTIILIGIIWLLFR